MSGADIWMPIVVGDHLVDTAALSAEQHGAFVWLLLHQWRAGPLPDDDAELAAIARVDTRTWRRMAPAIRRLFIASPDGLLHQRSAAEKVVAVANAARRASAASRAALARWHADDLQCNAAGTADGHARRNASRMPGGLREGCASPSPSPSPLPKDPPLRFAPGEAAQARPSRGTRLTADWTPTEADRDFAARLGLDPVQVAGQFSDYWHAKAGKDAMKVDWASVWRVWCRREVERRPRQATVLPLEAANRATPTSRRAWALAPSPGPVIDGVADPDSVR